MVEEQSQPWPTPLLGGIEEPSVLFRGLRWLWGLLDGKVELVVIVLCVWNGDRTDVTLAAKHESTWRLACRTSCSCFSGAFQRGEILQMTDINIRIIAKVAWDGGRSTSIVGVM